jgi:hypothetical protein
MVILNFTIIRQYYVINNKCLNICKKVKKGPIYVVPAAAAILLCIAMVP